MRPGAIVVANKTDCADSHVVFENPSRMHWNGTVQVVSATASSEEAAKHVENRSAGRLAAARGRATSKH